MKRRFIVLLSFLFLFITYSCGEGSDKTKQEELDDPFDYFESIVGLQSEIGQAILNVDWEAGTDKVREQVALVKKTAKRNLKTLKKIKLSKNDYGLKSAAVDLFKFYIKLSDYYILNMCDVMDKMEDPENEDRVLEYYDELLKIQEDVSNEEGPLDANFEVAQNLFAKTYGFSIKANPLQEDIDNMQE